LGSRETNPINQNKQSLPLSMLITTNSFGKVVLIQKIILKTEVIEDFTNKINPFCEQYHIVTGIARPQICKIMVENFGKEIQYKDDWIRKKIKEKYKSQPRVRNAKLRSKKSRLRKIPEKINKLEGQLAELTKVTYDYAKSG